MPSVATSLQVTPIDHGPDSLCRFGVEVKGVKVGELEEWSESTWKSIKDLVFQHKVVIFKDQGELHPSKQLELMQRYCGGEPEGMHSRDPHLFKLRAGAPCFIPEVPTCQIVGVGVVPEGHYGIGGQTITQRTSRHLYKTPLTEEEQKEGIVRLVQLHFDGPLYEIHPPQVGSLFCVQPPHGDPLTLRFDNGNPGTKSIAPGSTIYFDMSQAYDLLNPAQKAIVDNSRVAYAPRAFTWMSTTRFTEDGASIYSEGKEMSLEDVPEWREEECKTYPMVWINPLNGQKSLQIHGQAAWKLYLKDSPDGPVRVVEDLQEVRDFVHGLHKIFLKPEYAFAAQYEKGDLLIWYNMGLMHSATEYLVGGRTLEEMGTRCMHQINVAHTFGPEHGTLAN